MAAEMPGHLQTLVTATSDGTGTGLIPADAMFTTVTSSAGTQQVNLPAGFIGLTIEGYVGTNGFRLRTIAGSGDTINNVNTSAGANATIPATVFFKAQKITATGWILRTRTNLGAEGTAIVPA